MQLAARAAAAEAAQSSNLVFGGERGAGMDAQSRYYAMAHSVEESITKQPSLLRPPGDATLREYQMVGVRDAGLLGCRMGRQFFRRKTSS